MTAHWEQLWGAYGLAREGSGDVLSLHWQDIMLVHSDVGQKHHSC